jgi:hypothetical protein
MVRLHADSGGRRQAGRSFVEVIFILLILGAAFAYYAPKYLGVGTGMSSPKTDASVLSDARDVSCRTNLNVIRQAVAAKRTSGATVKTLEDAGIAGDAKCPAGAEAYTYSAESGSIRCPHPGHEAF